MNIEQINEQLVLLRDELNELESIDHMDDDDHDRWFDVTEEMKRLESLLPSLEIQPDNRYCDPEYLDMIEMQDDDEHWDAETDYWR